MNNKNEKRNSIRVGIKLLTSIIKSGGDYELVKGSNKMKTITIHIKDISTGGLCIESKEQFRSGVSADIQIPKIKNLDSSLVTCEVMRSVFIEDPLYHINLGTENDKSYFEVGLKFKNPNTLYLKNLYELAKTNQI